MLDRLLLFGKKLVLGVSLCSHLVPFDVLGALQRVPTNLLTLLLFFLRLVLTSIRSLRLGTMVFPIITLIIIRLPEDANFHIKYNRLYTYIIQIAYM